MCEIGIYIVSENVIFFIELGVKTVAGGVAVVRGGEYSHCLPLIAKLLEGRRW